MSQLDDDVTVVITNKPDSELYAVFEESNFDINVGESAKIDVKQAINYIKSGQAEISETVGDITGEFNDNAVEKTNAFNQNAEDKISAFDLNATNKINDFNINAVNKTTNFNDNATSKTGAFDSNAVDKTNDFNLNASNKTTDFNNNYLEKKALIDAEVQTAEAYSDEAKQWAIGEPTEPTGYSAKYWANEAASELSGLTSRVSTIEGKIPAEASSSNQLTDKSYVDNMDIDLQRQIDALVVSSDVFDIVGTYAELQAYDISTVPVNDIIKVLVDETHSGAATYYRCVENSDVKSWSYIGSEGAYYTKSEADNRFATPSDIGNATITITQGGVSKGTFTTNQSGNATIDVDAATIPSNMVTTDTDQTITGKKVLGGKDKTMLANANITKGTNPASTQYINFGLFGDTTYSYTDRLGCMETSLDSSGNVTTFLRAYKNEASSSTVGSITVNYPASGSPYATAPTPTEDTNNSVQIDTVGARNTKLAGYVDTSTNQDIAGTKTFTGTVQVDGNFGNKNPNVTKGTNPETTQYWNNYFIDKNGTAGTNSLGAVITTLATNGLVQTSMYAYKNASGTTSEKISIYYPATGNPYTYAPTPPVGDNSTKIATTAFVKAQDYATKTYADGLIGNARYATSTSAADATEKAVSIPAITTLSAGQCIIVQPTITSTVANSTIKLNSFTAYPMRYNNAAITTSTDSVVWNQNYPTVWMFDGTYWVFITHGIDSNTTYSAMSVAEGTTGTATSSRTMRADYLKQILDNRIQLVNSLPATTESNILYCIPES